MMFCNSIFHILNKYVSPTKEVIFQEYNHEKDFVYRCKSYLRMARNLTIN